MSRWTKRLWTDSEFSTLAELWVRGVHISDIAIKLGRAPTAIRQRAAMRGLARPDGYFGSKSHKVVQITPCHD